MDGAGRRGVRVVLPSPASCRAIARLAHLCSLYNSTEVTPVSLKLIWCHSMSQPEISLMYQCEVCHVSNALLCNLKPIQKDNLSILYELGRHVDQQWAFEQMWDVEHNAISLFADHNTVRWRPFGRVPDGAQDNSAACNCSPHATCYSNTSKMHLARIP